MNIKNILTNFAIWIFTGFTVIGFIVIYVGMGGRGRYRFAEETNWYFVGIGAVLLLPFVFYMVKTKFLINKITDENAERLMNLLTNGDVISVDLDELKIQSNNYKHDISVGSGINQRNEYIDINHNVILLDIPYKNKTIKGKLNINMDTTKLRMHFAIKEKTELYVDPNDPSNYFLDLRFLEK